MESYISEALARLPRFNGFLIDEDIDPELCPTLRKFGFRAVSAIKIAPGDRDENHLVWARKRRKIFVTRDLFRNRETRYALHAELYYRGGHIIRLGGDEKQGNLID